MDSSIKRLVPIPEARQVLVGIGHTTIYELIKRGEIVKVNIGRRGFITSESLEAYLDRLSEASACTRTGTSDMVQSLTHATLKAPAPRRTA
jgi:excisionase family DNA binding protein